jgi:hypothetical protein
MVIRKVQIESVVRFYISYFKEESIPHIYACGLFALFDFLYFLSFVVLARFELNSVRSTAIVLFLFSINYLINKKVRAKKVDVLLINILYFSCALILLSFSIAFRAID